jgi:hypothetical protein
MNHGTKLSHASTTVTSEVTALSSHSQTTDSSAVGQEISIKLQSIQNIIPKRAPVSILRTIDDFYVEIFGPSCNWRHIDNGIDEHCQSANENAVFSGSLTPTCLCCHHTNAYEPTRQLYLPLKHRDKAICGSTAQVIGWEWLLPKEYSMLTWGCSILKWSPGYCN